MDYSQAFDVLLDWARHDPNIRAVILTGSAAANEQHELSDRDIELHVQDTTPLEEDDSWWCGLGEVLAVERLENGDDEPTRLVYYSGGKLDFTLVEAARGREYDRPFRVLLDKDHVAESFVLAERTPEIPDQSMFDEACNWASAASLMLAKAIVRDEPWAVMIRDHDLKAELLRMIEWHHSVRYGAARDVRHQGARMRVWMDSDIQKRLESCATTFAMKNNEDALLTTFDLFDELADGVARRAELTPFPLHAVRREIERILEHPAGRQPRQQPG